MYQLVLVFAADAPISIGIYNICTHLYWSLQQMHALVLVFIAGAHISIGLYNRLVFTQYNFTISVHTSYPSKPQNLTQCCCNFGSASQTMDQLHNYSKLILPG